MLYFCRSICFFLSNNHNAIIGSFTFVGSQSYSEFLLIHFSTFTHWTPQPFINFLLHSIISVYHIIFFVTDKFVILSRLRSGKKFQSFLSYFLETIPSRELSLSRLLLFLYWKRFPPSSSGYFIQLHFVDYDMNLMNSIKL